MRIACQTQLLTGQSTLAKWQMAQALGFDALELQGGRLEQLAEMTLDWQAAKKSGAVISSICLSGAPFIGAFEQPQRQAAQTRIRRLLESAAELGAAGVVTPAAWGIFSTRLPPHIPPRSKEEDNAVLLEALDALGRYASQLGVHIFFEPLNRYEDHMVNTLAEAVQLIQPLKHSSLKILADTYHMNIEEANPIQALCDHALWLGHVHLSDSNRFEPGSGHLDFATILETLNEIGFAGTCALECRLSDVPEVALPKSLARLGY